MNAPEHRFKVNQLTPCWRGSWVFRRSDDCSETNLQIKDPSGERESKSLVFSIFHLLCGEVEAMRFRDDINLILRNAPLPSQGRPVSEGVRYGIDNGARSLNAEFFPGVDQQGLREAVGETAQGHLVPSGIAGAGSIG